MTDTDAYEEGYDTYWDGGDASENPYDEKEEPDARLAWEQGWRKAQEQDYDESD
jgi:hypothetical protein